MMNKSLLLIFLATFGVAVPAHPPSQRRVKFARDLTIGRATMGGNGKVEHYIIALEPTAVDPHARGAWLNTVLSSHNLAQRDLSSTDLKLMWDETIFDGFSGTFNEAEIKALKAQDDVNYIEIDGTVVMGGMTVQNDATWGLSRISSWTIPLPPGSDLDTLDFNYGYDERAGEGVDIYILDSGVRTSHSDFEGRAKFLDTTGPGVPGEDKQGHGTHVAGITAGSKYGVAKKASILAIKCIDDNGQGRESDTITAIQVAVHSAVSSGRPSIINLSIYTPDKQSPDGAVINPSSNKRASRSFDEAVINAVNHGVPVVVLAGNEHLDASNFSPGHVGGAGGNPGVITVGATTITDGWYSLSNYGPNIDVLAPGVDIWSCGISDDDAVAKKSGTSMAAAYVSGVAALIMSQEGKLSPSDLKSKILSLSMPALINGLPSGTTNLLAYNRGVVTGGKWDTSAAMMCSRKVEPPNSVAALVPDL